MSRSLEVTQPAIVPASTFVTLFTVPTGHKYELIGVSLTCGTITGTTNVAGLHTFASTAAVLDWFVQTDPAHAGLVQVPGLSEAFYAHDKFSVIWAPGSGNGQVICWYIDVNYL